MERLFPQPTDEQLGRIYGEKYYDAWGLQNKHDLVRDMKKGTFRRIVRGAGRLPSGAKVLDCGAATGFLLEVVQEEGYTPYGIELSEFGAEAIERKFGKGHAFCGNVEDAKFGGLENGGFSAIFMCDFIEHVRHPERVLRRAFDMLAPGGILALTTPKVGSATYRAMGHSWTHHKEEHLFYFSTTAMKTLLERVGFQGFRESLAWKSMNLEYIAHQFKVYPHPLLSRAVETTMALVPERVAQQTFPILMGELLAYARKP